MAGRATCGAFRAGLCLPMPLQRAKDFSGLPPAYTFVSTREPFYAETLAYVENLRRAGVEATVDVYPGLFHAFDMLLPFLKVSRQAAAAFEAHFESALRRSAG